jgi:hypothetical protein
MTNYVRSQDMPSTNIVTYQKRNIVGKESERMICFQPGREERGGEGREGRGRGE